MKSRFLSISLMTAGIILMALNIGIWINGLFINRSNGMDLVLALRLLVIGALLLLGWYRIATTPKPSKQSNGNLFFVSCC